MICYTKVPKDEVLIKVMLMQIIWEINYLLKLLYLFLQLQGLDNSAYLDLLRLFAQGTWSDYKSMIFLYHCFPFVAINSLKY